MPFTNRAVSIKGLIYIPLERKCIREDMSVGGNVLKPIYDTIFMVTGYDWVLAGVPCDYKGYSVIKF